MKHDNMTVNPDTPTNRTPKKTHRIIITKTITASGHEISNGNEIKTDAQNRNQGNPSNPTKKSTTIMPANQRTQHHAKKRNANHATETEIYTFKAKANHMENGSPQE
jgi:hypothetical protein